MKWLRRLSIRRKLTSIVMIRTAAALLLACAGFMVADLFLQHGSLSRNLVTLAKILASNSTASITFGDHPAAREILGALRVKDSIIGACIYDEHGKPFATYVGKNGDGYAPPPPHHDGVFVDGATIEVFHPIMLDGKRIGTITILSDISIVTTRLIRFAQVSFGIIIAALIVALLTVTRLQRVITDPIRGLERVTAEVSRNKNYSIRVSEAAGNTDEIANLIHHFNEMLAEIERCDAILENQVAARTAELSDTSRRMQMILDTVADGILGVGLDGELTFLNPAGSRMLQREPGDFKGRSLHELTHHSHPDGRPYAIAECPLATAARRGELLETIETLWRADGSSFQAEFIATPMRDESGTHLGAVITFRDITQRQEVERMKSEFVSTVSHELRTPLTSIRGALGLLAAGFLGSIGDKGQHMLDIAISNTDRLVRLINDILDIERMAAGRVELHRTLVDVHDLFRQSADVMQAMADRAGVSLIVQPAHESLWIDPDRIMQLLTNLLSNAIKFSPRGGSVTLSGESRNGTFTFRVDDEGRGIPQDKLLTVFERFKQVDASDSRDKGGTGLGLAICQTIVTMHGGRIWAESSVGEGSVFQVALPIHPAEISIEATATPQGERTILICEEDRHLIPDLALMLQRHGMKTLLVGSRETLVERAQASEPDAVIFDVATPGSDGWRIIDHLKANEATRDIPIIVASMHGGESVEMYAGRVAGWVRKPYEEREVLHAVTLACHAPTILVVEDDIDLARIMTLSLESHGIRTVHAASGRAAIDCVKNDVPDLIVLDLILPELDGFAVVDWLKRSSALSRIPLIVYSALEVNVAQQAQLRLGPTEFLTKSRASLDEFEEHVIRLLSAVTGDETEVLGVA